MALRSPRDLSPVSLTRAPEEASALVDSINYLLNQLEKVLETQNRFIADAAHQLRTPLAGIMAQLEVAQRELDPKELQVSLAQMASSMERLSHLVNQLLALARNQPEAARTLAMMCIDLNQLAQQATIEMAPAALQKEIDIGFEGQEQPCYIEGNAQRLHEMLSNLIDNAIRYTQRKGKVTVSLKHVDGTLQLLVEDNGPGIPPDEQEKVFERFHRVLSGEYPNGSGLGLAIVREIAHIHNASVSLMSGAGDKGTRVQIIFKELVTANHQSADGVTELPAT
jgi:two-component system sensor histidine kinase TctE